MVPKLFVFVSLSFIFEKTNHEKELWLAVLIDQRNNNYCKEIIA